MIFYTDYIGGSNLNGGTSFSVLASGSDGVSSSGSSNFYSASATFTSDMVGHVIGTLYGTYDMRYYEIIAFVDAHNLTLGDRWSPMSGSAATGIAFKVGGRWRSPGYNGYNGNLAAGSPELEYDTSTLGCLAGDEVREIASPTPNSLGDAVWTQDSMTVTLAAPVAADIDPCTASWTLANGSTTATDTVAQIGATSSRFAFPSSRASNTKYFYKALASTIDLSAWQRVCFWFRRDSGMMTATGDMRLCLCSDTAGAVIVADLPIPQIPMSGGWYPVVIDFGAALPVSVASIAVYTGTTLPTASLAFDINNMIAVKPAGDALEFTLATLIGKVHNSYWQASHAYSSSAIRKPTPPNRNGLRYQITTAGTSGSTEPAWPEAEGATVADGSAVWTCEGPEDTWYPIRGISGGVTVTLDKGGNTTFPSNLSSHFYTETETVETFGRGVTDFRFTSASDDGKWFLNFYLGTPQNPNKVSGGWSRGDMSVMDGETWFDGGRFAGGVVSVAYDYSIVENLNAVRGKYGFFMSRARGVLVKNCHAVSNTNGFKQGETTGISTSGVRIVGAVANCNLNAGLVDSATLANPAPSMVLLDRVRADSNAQEGIHLSGTHHSQLWARRNGGVGSRQAGLVFVAGAPGPMIAREVKTAGNLTCGACYSNSGNYNMPDIHLIDAVMGETTPIALPAAVSDAKIVCQNFQGTTGYHKTFATDVIMESENGADRHTGSGLAWKVTISASTHARNKYFPFTIPFKVAAAAGTAVTTGVYVKRVTTDSVMEFRLLGGIIPGVPIDVISSASAAADTYEQLIITCTPTSAGVLQFELAIYPIADTYGDVDSSTRVVFFDDFSVA